MGVPPPGHPLAAGSPTRVATKGGSLCVTQDAKEEREVSAFASASRVDGIVALPSLLGSQRTRCVFCLEVAT